MLNAILNGKARRLPPGVSEGDSLNSVFRAAEDLLTATVFERFAYLSAPVLLQVLAATFQLNGLGDQTNAELEDIEFWPTWGQGKESLGQSVQPDVFMRLSFGKPLRRVDLIVECKLADWQTSGQWRREWVAYRAEYAASEQADEVWLLALGGLKGGGQVTVDRLRSELGVDRSLEPLDIRAAAADWSDLLRALAELDGLTPAERRIVHDIKAGLGLVGYLEFRSMRTLSAVAAKYATKDASAAALRLVGSR